MNKYVLIAYASKYGATEEIAEVIGQAIARAGFGIDVRDADSVESLTGYVGVVLGSAVYAGQWQKEAAHFLQQFEEELRALPLWIFSSGPIDEGDPVELLEGWQLPKAQEAIVARIAPRDITVFHGKIDPHRLHWGERLLIRAIRGKTGDFRDWDSISAWGTQIATALLDAQSIAEQVG